MRECDRQAMFVTVSYLLSGNTITVSNIKKWLSFNSHWSTVQKYLKQ